MKPLQRKMAPPETKGHLSVASLNAHWFALCPSKKLRARPLKRTLLGIPMVLFRDSDGVPSALLDRCPHRNVPLSNGRVVGGELECGYHGWRFAASGRCTKVPGLCEKGSSEQRRVARFPTREIDGFVWVYPTAEEANAEGDVEAPKRAPFPLEQLGWGDYTHVIREVSAFTTLHAMAENALDVPHTAYLHKGLFRGGEKKRIEVRVKRWLDRVEAEYIGEPRPPGVIGKLLTPSGGEVEHWDRFFLPSIAQVEYRLGPENHIVITALMVPVEDFKTTIHAVISYRFRVPWWIIRPLIEPLGYLLFKQDGEVLGAQMKAIQNFGGEQYMSTDADVLGPHIWRLLRNAERGELEDVGAESECGGVEPVFEKGFEMLV